MTYGKLSMQREGDKTIMDFLLPYMTTNEKMTSVNRCRCSLNAIFLSDICPSEHRTKLFLDNVGELEHWMESNDATCPELAYWIVKYLQGRGSIAFSELGPLSPQMEQLGKSQDTIGWRNMLEGRVSIQFYTIQCHHLAGQRASKLTVEDWMRGFITHLIHISHSQWLFRNFTLHDRLHGYRNLKDRAEVALRIEILSHTDPDRIPEHSRFLLDIDTERLAKSDFDTVLLGGGDGSSLWCINSSYHRENKSAQIKYLWNLSSSRIDSPGNEGDLSIKHNHHNYSQSSQDGAT
jgi:hypothetical protein